MNFNDFCQYLEKLENTASRNDMTVILAEMFEKTSAEDARLVAYMCQGRLGPAYKSPDFGVADKSMVKALGEEAQKIFHQTGDLGKTVEQIKSQSSNPKSQINYKSQNIKFVYEKLWEIASISGNGSVDKKQQLITSLLDELDPVSAKYAVKMILGKLRTGFSDMTILDSLSWMLSGDKSLRKNIESIYNVRADLGEVASLTKNLKFEIRNLKIDPKIGTPVLMARAERAVNAADIWKRNGVCAVEYKLDGLRIQAHIIKSQIPNPKSQINSKLQNQNIKLFSRGLEDVTSMYPDIVEGLQKQIKHNCIVEGEMIAVAEDGHFLPFQETSQRKRKYNIEEMTKKVPLKIYLFDVLSCDGRSLLHQKNEERRKKLEIIFLDGSVVKLMPRINISSEKEIEDFFQLALKDGTEGIIAKKLDGPYQAGARDFNWIKYKKSYQKSALSDTLDVVIMGYDEGQGKRSKFGIGDFLAGIYQPETDRYLTVAKIGTGLTDDEWLRAASSLKPQITNPKPENYEVSNQMACDHWVKPKIVVEILADEITKSPMHTSGYALRFPRLVSFREKKPEDATSMKELEKMFKLQRTGGDLDGSKK